jgi:hypothetical protein
MRLFVTLLAFSLLVLPARAASEDDEDWKLIGGALALLQQIVQVAAHSSDPEAARKRVDAMLAGENPQANRVAARMMDDLLQEVPLEHRGTFAAITRDLLVLARREQARGPAPATHDIEDAIRARKELQAMGLRYWDEKQFIDAVRRGDRIAVELFLAGRGLEAERRGAPAPKNPPAGR